MDHHPALAAELELEHLAGAAPQHGLEAAGVDAGLHRHTVGPQHHGVGVGHGTGLGHVEDDGLTVGGDGHVAGSPQAHLVEAAGHGAGHHPHSAPAGADPLDVHLDGGAVGQHRGTVAEHGVVLQVHDLDVHALVGQEHLPVAGDLHGHHAFGGDGLLDHLGQSARPQVLEGSLALVGDHGAGLGHDRPVLEADLEQLLVLEVERVSRLVLVVLSEIAVDHLSTPGFGPAPGLGRRQTRARTGCGAASSCPETRWVLSGSGCVRPSGR